MKRKLLSFAIAFALIAQTLVYAAPSLTSLLGSTIEVDIDKSDDIGRTDVNATVTSFVKGSTEGDTAYAATTTASSFDYKVGINFETVRQAFDACYTRGLAFAATANSPADYSTNFKNSDITGEFYIIFKYDTNITGTLPTTADLVLPTGSIFAVTDVSQTASDTIKVTVNVASPIKVSALKADIDTVDGEGKYIGTALADFELVWQGLSATSQNRHIKASLTGHVNVTEDPVPDSPFAIPFAKVNFTSNTSDVTAAYYVSTGGGGGGGSYKPIKKNDVVVPENKNITIGKQELNEANGVLEVELVGEDETAPVTIKSKPAAKKGFVENGYSLTPYAGGDADYAGETYIPDMPVGRSVSLYPRYVNVTVPSALAQDTDENGNPLHKVYISGYPDGEVKPNNNISREEVTAAFDRLLNTVYRETIAADEQDFPDVNDDRWSNDSIATMANGGFIVGDENGNFNPSKPITRAEFTVIASKFAPTDAELADNYFTDVDGHWAKDFILKVAGQYWISGYTDGSFNPDGYITRAEAMAIINRMLVRYGDADAEYGKDWSDVSESDWFYDIVREATTDNVFVRTENGWSEKWVAPEVTEVAEEETDETAAEETEAETPSEEDSDAETEIAEEE